MSSAIVTASRPGQDRDRGAILLLVLAVSIVLSLVVLALANFVMADLRYSQVVDSQAKRLASAQSGIDYAVDRLRLNQTLCATDVAGGGAVSLNGSSSAGTPLPAALNGTNTTVTCKRLDGAIADVAGWAVVIADPLSGPSSRLEINIPGTARVGGPVFLRDPIRRTTDTDSIIELVDGDLWYDGNRWNFGTPGCNPPKHSSDLPAGLAVGPTIARGPECTTRLWSELFSAPLPSLPTNIAGDTDGDGVVDPASDSDGDGLLDGVLVGSCRVFSPGRYTMMPDIPSGTRAYFQSGEYHLDFIPTALNPSTQWTIAHTVSVWVGHAGPLAGSEQVPNAACEPVRNADVGHGTGATFYFDGTSRLKLESDGNVEMFARQQGQYMVSAQELSGNPSTSTEPLFLTLDFGLAPTDLVIHGLVWAPDGWFTFDTDNPGALQKLLGGIVVGGLRTPRVDLTSTAGVPHFEIRPATSTVDTRILVTSTSTLNGGSTRVEAVVAYRPQAANLDDRVAVTSFRVVD